jgi:hypothetical protein
MGSAIINLWLSEIVNPVWDVTLLFSTEMLMSCPLGSVDRIIAVKPSHRRFTSPHLTSRGITLQHMEVINQLFHFPSLKPFIHIEV